MYMKNSLTSFTARVPMSYYLVFILRMVFSSTLGLILCQPLYNTGHHVYMDNYFSSPSLFVELKTNQVCACGTLQTNCVGVPEKIKKTKLKKEGPAVTDIDGNGLQLF